MAAKRILIAEDESILADTLRGKLTKMGYEVKIAYNGEEAMELLKKEMFDLVVLDLIMPLKDGFAVLAEKPQTQNKATPVHVLTVLAQEDQLKRALDLGAKVCYIKSKMAMAEVIKNIQQEVEKSV